MLGMGSITYFITPTACGLLLSSYLSLLCADYLKSLKVVKYGGDPWWSWKINDVGFIMASIFGTITFVGVTKTGISKLKERANKALILKNTEDKKQ